MPLSPSTSYAPTTLPTTAVSTIKQLIAEYKALEQPTVPDDAPSDDE
jgi:hypothetical protein